MLLLVENRLLCLGRVPHIIQLIIQALFLARVIETESRTVALEASTGLLGCRCQTAFCMFVFS